MSLTILDLTETSAKAIGEVEAFFAHDIALVRAVQVLTKLGAVYALVSVFLALVDIF